MVDVSTQRNLAMSEDNKKEKTTNDRQRLDEFGLKLPTQPKTTPQPTSKPKPTEEKKSK